MLRQSYKKKLVVTLAAIENLLNVKRSVGLILRIIVAAASLVFIGMKVYGQLSDGLPSEWIGISVAPLLATIALVPANWLIEALKWQRLTTHLQPLSLVQAVKSVLTGLAVSMLTPNRVGDFAGRIALLKPDNRTAGTMAAFVGGYAQMLAIALLGVTAFCLNPMLPDFLIWTTHHRIFAIAVLLAAATMLTVLYFFAGKCAAKFKFRRWLWLERFVTSAGQHTQTQLAVALGLSIIRSGVFMIQLWLMMTAVGLCFNIGPALCAITVMYCFVSVIPTFALAEWGVRGSMALLFIAPLGGNPAQIVAATIALWLINVALPAAVGAIWGILPSKNNDEKSGN